MKCLPVKGTSLLSTKLFALRIRFHPFPLGPPGREVAAPGDDRAIVEGFKGDTCTVVTFLCDGPQLVKGPQEVRIEWLVNGLVHLLINRVN